MIAIKVEFWPDGDESKALHVAKATLVKTNSSLTRGDYDVRIYTSKNAKRQGLWRSGRVEGFPRNKLGTWDLMFRALLSMLWSRNKDHTIKYIREITSHAPDKSKGERWRRNDRNNPMPD